MRAELNTWQRERQMIYSRLKNNRHIVLSSFSHPIYPPQRIIDAIHAPEMLRRCDFLLLLLLLFLRSLFFFFLPTPSVPGALEALFFKFVFPLRLSVTDWQRSTWQEFRWQTRIRSDMWCDIKRSQELTHTHTHKPKHCFYTHTHTLILTRWSMSAGI